MRLILARHAETVKNAEHINQGHGDSLLTENGQQQAKQLAAALADEGIEHIYASDLGRVQATLQPLKELLPHVTITITEELREQLMGELEGSPWGSVSEAAAEAGISRYDYTPKGGESIREMGDRVERFAKKAFTEHPEEVVCFYTHGGPVSEITMRLLTIPDEQFRMYHPANAEYTVLVVNQHGTRLVQRRVNKHLN